MLFFDNWVDQVVRIGTQNGLELRVEEEIKKAEQLAEDNKILLEKLQLLELDKVDMNEKIKDLENDNLNLMK
jgi:hypothetical protein